MTRNRSIADQYYEWLCEIVGVEFKEASYYLLLKALHLREFTWTVPNDDNRAAEGRNLRDKFVSEAFFHEDSSVIGGIFNRLNEQKTISLLEVMIGLAINCADIMANQGLGEVDKWFWTMIENAGLHIYSDENYYGRAGIDHVGHIIDRIIGRTYHRNGRGGLFPLHMDHKDQRKVELWYQMNAYLVENYYQE